MTTRVLQKLKPMLAGKATDEQIEKLFESKSEMYASPKLDGIRCMIQDATALSRSLKPIRNEFIQSILGNEMLDGLDGEIISGDPTADDVYRITTSNVMRATGKPDFTFWVFDTFIYPYPYMGRQHEIYRIDPTGIHPNIKILPTVSVFNMKELQAYEQRCLGQGYEGVILRDPNGAYKHGRSTAKEGGLIKVKRFTDSET